MRVTPAVVLVALLGACRKETIDKPPAPAMADVLDAFNAPTGTFDASTAGAVRGAIDDAANGLLGVGAPDRIVTAIEDAVKQSQSSSSKPTATSTGTLHPRDFDGDGYGHIARICDGFGTTPTPDEQANGRLDLTFTFSKITLDPVIWGDAVQCLYLLGGKRLRLDHGGAPDALRLYVGESTKVEDLPKTPLVLALDVLATLDDKPIAGKLAVRFVYQSAQVELSVPVTNGNVIVTVASGNALAVRAKNGTFQCDPATRRCTGQAGGEVTL